MLKKDQKSLSKLTPIQEEVNSDGFFVEDSNDDDQLESDSSQFSNESYIKKIEKSKYWYKVKYAIREFKVAERKELKKQTMVKMQSLQAKLNGSRSKRNNKVTPI